MPSSHVTIDPQALPGGVVRSIARSPTMGIDCITEDQEELADVTMVDGFSSHASLHTAQDIRSQQLHHIPPYQYPSSLPSQVSSTPITTSADVPTPTSRITKRDSMKTKKVVNPTRSERPAIANGPSSSSQRTTVPPQEESHFITHHDDLPHLQPGSTDGDPGALGLTSLTLQSPSPSQAAPATPSAPSSSSGSTDHTPAYPSQSSPANSRKRKTTSPTPRPKQQRNRSTPDADQSDDTMEGSEDGQDLISNPQAESASRMCRRSSVRARASVNYALPKLNTKMRKPDPEDLKPAKSSRVRKSSSSTANGDLKGLRDQKQRPSQVEASQPKRTMSPATAAAPAASEAAQRTQSEDCTLTESEAEGDNTVTASNFTEMPPTASSAAHPTTSGESLSELFHVHRDDRSSFRTHRGGRVDAGSRDTSDDEHDETSGSELDEMEVMMDQAEDEVADRRTDRLSHASPHMSASTETTPKSSTSSLPSKTATKARRRTTNTTTISTPTEPQSARPSSAGEIPLSGTSRLTKSTAASRGRSAAGEAASIARRKSTATTTPASSSIKAEGNGAAPFRSASASDSARPSLASSTSSSSLNSSSPGALLTSLGLPQTNFVFASSIDRDRAEGVASGANTASSRQSSASTGGPRKLAALRKLSVNGTSTSSSSSSVPGSAPVSATGPQKPHVVVGKVRVSSTGENINPTSSSSSS